MRLLKLVLTLAVIAASSFTAKAEDVPPVIRFGAFGQGFGQPYGTAVMAIAQVKGFIADEFKGSPVQLTFEYFTGTGPAINEAIANNRLDFAQYGALPNIIGKAAGLPTHIIGSYGTTTVFGVARADLPVTSFKDLKGRKVGVSKGTILHWALLKGLEGSGMTLKDIQLIDLKTQDQLAALSAGSIDAAIGSSTHLVLRDKGIVKVFYNSKDLGPKAAGFGALTVSEPFEKKYPEATQKVVRGFVKAAAWLSDEANREEAFQIWTKSGVTYESQRDEFEGVLLKDVFNPRSDDFLISQYRDGVAFTKDQKLIRADINVDAWFTPQYVEKAIKELNLTKLWPNRNADGVAVTQ